MSVPTLNVAGPGSGFFARGMPSLDCGAVDRIGRIDRFDRIDGASGSTGHPDRRGIRLATGWVIGRAANEPPC